MNASVLAQLEATISPDSLLVGERIDRKFYGLGEMAPAAVVRPRSTAEVSALLRACHRSRTPVVTRGGGTGFNGGTTPQSGEIVLSLDRMNALAPVDLDSASVLVEAGAILEHVQRAADEADLHLGLEMGARGSCTIGGNLATNAGGSRVIRYGMARAQVLGLEAVLADGTVLSSLGELVKNNAGYDLNQLFVGSEGTLGVITRARLRLHERPAFHLAALVALPGVTEALALLRRLRRDLGPGLSAFELIWGDVYNGVVDQGLHGTGQPPLQPGQPLYALVEAQWGPQNDLTAVLESALADGLEGETIHDAALSQSEADYRHFWQVREGCSEFIRARSNCYGFDVGIPLRNMAAFTERARERLATVDPQAIAHVFGHLGDGNLHFIVETRHPDLATQVVYTEVVGAGGTIAAEHGIGFEKKPYLQLSRCPAELSTMRLLKRALDPYNILNAGRVFDLEPALELSDGPGF